ncbi:hypothetical protein D3C85_943590 [compost metagenome]
MFGDRVWRPGYHSYASVPFNRLFSGSSFMAAMRGRVSALPGFLSVPVRQPAYSCHLFVWRRISGGSNYTWRLTMSKIVPDPPVHYPKAWWGAPLVVLSLHTGRHVQRPGWRFARAKYPGQHHRRHQPHPLGHQPVQCRGSFGHRHHWPYQGGGRLLLHHAISLATGDDGAR